ncbi:MAG TPA: nucleotidyltransferase [Bacillaceae bacterium]
MISTGIVAEYNPFHNGHQYQVKEAREMTEADVIIAVMSGNFLQRGEPALISKWSRTEMALKGGVDIVIELPYAFAVQQAEHFAAGAIRLLDELGCDHVCFGSENGSIEPFLAAANLVKERLTIYNKAVEANMKEGMSYPSALSRAFESLCPGEDMLDLSKPNNILGYRYVSSVIDLQSNMKPCTVKRKHAEYHDENFGEGTIASATAIRKAIYDKKLDAIKPYVPDTTFLQLEAYKAAFGQHHFWDLYWPFLQYRILTMKPQELRRIYEMEEGIEFRIKKAAGTAASFHDFITAVKTKRYTWTRIQRICVHILTNTNKSTMAEHGSAPEYIRLLGMTDAGRMYLNKVKSRLSLPLVSKLSSWPEKLMEMDIRAGLVYAQGLPSPVRKKLSRMEYAQPPILAP